jgi:ABC-type Na+ efflux pump permease subunit
VSFRLGRAFAVFWKDSKDLLQSKALLVSMLAMPAMFVVVPVAVIYAYVHRTEGGALQTMAMYYNAPAESAQTAARFLVEKTLTDWFGLYLIMPVFVPILISSQSVAGEKERRTLEPLLASPVTVAELLVGKSLAAVLPAVVISYAAYGVLCLGVDLVGWKLVQGPLLPNTLWSVGVLGIAPLFAFFGNGVAVLVSARVGDARLSQQLSALVILPLVGLVGGQIAGFLRAGPFFYAVQAVVVAGLDLALVVLTVRLFDRERLVSRWTS